MLQNEKRYAEYIQHKVTCCHMKDVYARKSKEIERKNDFDLLLTTMEELDLFEYKLNNMVYIIKYFLYILTMYFMGRLYLILNLNQQV